MKPFYVGYFTIGTPYQYEAVECMNTLDHFGLDEHEFVGVPDAGSWVANCAQKPEVIRRLMRKHDGRALVYLDADARVRKYPDLFDRLDCDFAAHWRHGEELLSGTMYFGPTKAARSLCEAWQRYCSASPHLWDQVVLASVLDGTTGLRVERLPSTYTRVFDDPKMGEPVVEHLQRSRQFAKAAT